MKPGLYSEGKLIGSKVKIISSPAYTIFQDTDKTYYIKQIEYKVDIDGKLRPSVILEGLPNNRFRPEDLKIIEIGRCDWTYDPVEPEFSVESGHLFIDVDGVFLIENGHLIYEHES